MGAPSLKIAIGATLVGGLVIAFQATVLGPRLRLSAGEGGSSDVTGVTVTAEPEGVTASATVVKVREGEVAYDGLLDSVSDFEDVGQNRAYAKLVEDTRHLTDAEAAKILRQDLDYQKLVRSPKASRGELVRFDGLLIQLEPIRLVPGAGPPGVEDAWRGWLLEPGGDELYVFDLIGDPPPISTRDLVRVEGTFLKILRYESGKYHIVRNENGDPVLDRKGQPVRSNLRDAPFLIARWARKLSEQEIDRPFRWDYVVAVLLCIFGAFVLVRRKMAGEEQTLLDSRRAEAARKAALDALKATAKAPPPPPSDSKTIDEKRDGTSPGPATA